MRIRLGLWNRLYLVLASASIVAIPTALLLSQTNEMIARDAAWINHCGSAYLAPSPSDFDGYNRCVASTLEPVSTRLDSPALLRDAATGTVAGVIILWPLLWALVWVAKWIWRGRSVR